MAENDDFDLQDFLPYLLNQAAEESSLAFHRIYKSRYGMLRTEWRVVFHLGRYGAMTAREIGQRSKTHKTKISRAVAALEKRRYLTRERDQRDKRHEILTLTTSGQATYRDLRDIAQGYDADLEKSLTPDEVAVLRVALRKLGNLPD